MPLNVVYTKSTNIWDDLNPFVDKLVNSYKQAQQTKWDNEWQSVAIADIERANKPQEVNSLLEMQTQPKEILDIEGFKQNFAIPAMGMMQKKEVMTGNVEGETLDTNPGRLQQQEMMGGVGQSGVKAAPVTTGTPKMMPDKKEWGELYKYVSELPTGKVDWTNTLNLFKEKLDSGRQMGTSAQQFLSMIMGQMQPENQRAKVEQDVGFTNELSQVLNPKPSSDYERYMADPESYEAFKRAGQDPKTTFDYEKFLEEHGDEWQIDSITSAGTVKVGRKDNTKDYDFNSWKEATEWTKANPQAGFDWKIDPVKEGFNVTAVKHTTEPGGTTTKKLIPTPGVIKAHNKDMFDPNQDSKAVTANYGEKYDFSNAQGLKTPAERGKFFYDRALGGDTENYGMKDEDIVDKKGFVKDESEYVGLYKELEQGAKEYYEATGEILPKEYLSPKEAGTFTSNTWGAGYKGGIKNVLNTEKIPWSWVSELDPNQEVANQMIKNGDTIENIDIDALRKLGVDMNKVMQIIKDR